MQHTGPGMTNELASGTTESDEGHPTHPDSHMLDPGDSHSSLSFQSLLMKAAFF